MCLCCFFADVQTKPEKEINVGASRENRIFTSTPHHWSSRARFTFFRRGGGFFCRVCFFFYISSHFTTAGRIFLTVDFGAIERHQYLFFSTAAATAGRALETCLMCDNTRLLKPLKAAHLISSRRTIRKSPSFPASYGFFSLHTLQPLREN